MGTWKPWLKRPPPPPGLVPILAAPFWKLQDAAHTAKDTEGSGATKIPALLTVHGPDHQRQHQFPDLRLQQEGMHRNPPCKPQPRIPGRSRHCTGQTARQPGQRLGARRLSQAPGVQLWSVGSDWSGRLLSNTTQKRWGRNSLRSILVFLDSGKRKSGGLRNKRPPTLREG